ncbi:hypothetical protein HDZ31DRAFT_69888 [Schizophyllum fasciatum]
MPPPLPPCPPNEPEESDSQHTPAPPYSGSYLRFTVPTINFHKQLPVDWPARYHMCSAAHCYYPNSPKTVEGKFDCLGKSWCGGRCRGTYTVTLAEAKANDEAHKLQLLIEEKRKNAPPKPIDPYEADPVLREKVVTNAMSRIQKRKAQQAPANASNTSAVLLPGEDERERRQREAEEIARMRMERGGCCLPGLTEMAQAIVRPLSPSSLRARSRSRKRKDQRVADPPKPPPLPIASITLPKRSASLLPSPPPAGPIPPVPARPTASPTYPSSYHSSLGRSTRTARPTEPRPLLPDRPPLAPLHDPSIHSTAQSFSRPITPISSVTSHTAPSPRVRPAGPPARPMRADGDPSRPMSPFSLTKPSLRPRPQTRESTDRSDYSTDATAYSHYASTHSTRATTASPHRAPPAGVPKDVRSAASKERRSSASSSSRAVTMSDAYHVSLPASSHHSLPRRSHKSAQQRSLADSYWSLLERAGSPTRMPPPPVPFTETPTPAQCYAAMYKARCA